MLCCYNKAFFFHLSTFVQVATYIKFCSTFNAINFQNTKKFKSLPLQTPAAHSLWSRAPEE